MPDIQTSDPVPAATLGGVYRLLDELKAFLGRSAAFADFVAAFAEVSGKSPAELAYLFEEDPLQIPEDVLPDAWFPCFAVVSIAEESRGEKIGLGTSGNWDETRSAAVYFQLEAQNFSAASAVAICAAFSAILDEAKKDLAFINVLQWRQLDPRHDLPFKSEIDGGRVAYRLGFTFTERR